MATAETKPQVSEFVNEPFIDFSRPENRKRMEEALKKVAAEFGREYPIYILPADVHGGLAAKFRRDFLERFFHAFAVFGARKIVERLVSKFPKLRARFRGPQIHAS